MGDETVDIVSLAMKDLAFANGFEGQQRPLADMVVNCLREYGATDKEIVEIFSDKQVAE